MNKQDLEKQFQLAKESNSDIAIELTVPTREETEIIIVKNANLDYKLDYYKNNYNENLELERFTEIKILNVSLINWNLDLLL